MGEFATFAEKYVKYIAIAIAAVGILGGAALAGHYSAAANAKPAATQTPTPAATPMREYWAQTSAKVALSDAGQVPTTIMRLTLPAGAWIVHAEQTIVNFGASDFAGCSIGDATTRALNTHRTIVGNPGKGGAAGPAPLATDISETAAVTAPAPIDIVVTCEHDRPTPSGAQPPYIDPDADVWAQQSASVESPQ